LALLNAQGVVDPCVPYQGDGQYPTDGHFLVCGAAQQDGIGQQLINGVVEGLPHAPNEHNDVRGLFQSQGVTIFYHFDRNSANTYFANTYPYNLFDVFQTRLASCGYSAYRPTPFGQIIAVSIYEDCIDLVTGLHSANPDIPDVTKHELGHGFDFAIASTASSDRGESPSTSRAFAELLLQDLANLNLKVTGPPCHVFGSVAPTAIEVYPLPKPFNPVGVCDGQGQVNEKFLQMTNRQIAQTQDGYFLSSLAPFPPYEEIWAEEFAHHIDSLNPNRPAPFTEQIIPALVCTYGVVNWWFTSLTAPAYQSFPPITAYSSPCRPPRVAWPGNGGLLFAPIFGQR
jgi:hypothetical protein